MFLHNQYDVRYLHQLLTNLSGADICFLTGEKDPDSIAAAALVERLLSHFNITCHFRAARTSEWPETIALDRFLGGKPSFLSWWDPLEKRPEHVGLIDCNHWQPGLPGRKQLQPKIIIDHHGDTEYHVAQEDRFWVVEQVAASAVIAIELLEALRIPIPPHLRVAAAAAVYADCDGRLGEIGPRGRSVYRKGETVNSEALWDMTHPVLPEATQRIVDACMASDWDLRAHDLPHQGAVVSVVDTTLEEFGSPEQPGPSVVGRVARDLLNHRDRSIAIVVALVKSARGLMLRASARSQMNHSPEPLIHRLFQNKGGGRKGAGGLTVPLSTLWHDAPENPEDAIAFVRERLQDFGR